MESIIFERQDEVGIIRLNRPEKLNALSDDMLHQLIARLQEARDDEKIRVVVLKGEGRAFCAGTDISDLAKHRSIEEHKKTRLRDIQAVPHVLRKLGKPIIAAIHGYAAGAGFEISLHCDIRIASEDARLGVPEVLRGATVLAGTTYMLPRLIGLGRAKELVLTGDFIDAKEAERIGLVNKTVPLADLDKAVMSMARKLARGSALSVQLMRACLDSGPESSLEASLEAEEAASCLSVASGERGKMALKSFRSQKDVSDE